MLPQQNQHLIDSIIHTGSEGYRLSVCRHHYLLHICYTSVTQMDTGHAAPTKSTSN